MAIIQIAAAEPPPQSFLSSASPPTMTWERLITPNYPHQIGEYARYERELIGFTPDHFYTALVKEPGMTSIACEGGKLAPQLRFLQDAVNHRARSSGTFENEWAELGLMVISPDNPTIQGRANAFGLGIHFEFAQLPNFGLGRTLGQHYQLVSHSPMKCFSHLQGANQDSALILSDAYNNTAFCKYLAERAHASRSCKRFPASAGLSFDEAQLHQTYPHMEERQPRSFLHLVFGVYPPASATQSKGSSSRLGTFGRPVAYTIVNPNKKHTH